MKKIMLITDIDDYPKVCIPSGSICNVCSEEVGYLIVHNEETGEVFPVHNDEYTVVEE